MRHNSIPFILCSKRLKFAVASLVLVSSVQALAQATAQSGRNMNPAVEEVIITGRSLETTLPLELARYGADLEIVTAEQVQNHGFVDVAQSLEMLVPGLHLTTQAGAFSYVNLALQGSRTGDVLWTVDGVRINNRLYNSTSPADTLPSSMIERTEVLKGGHGLMYGTAAIAGVINVVTRSFSETLDAGVTAGTGSFGVRRLNGYARNTLGDGHKFVVWGSRDESEGYEIYDQYQPTSVFRKRGYEVDSVGIKYGYDFTPDLSLSLMGLHTEARLDYPNVSNVSVNDRVEDIFSARLDYTPAEGAQFFVKGYYHNWDTDYFTPPNPALYWGYEDIGISAGALFKPHDTFELHVGYDYQTYEGSDDVLVIAGLREDVNAVYAQVRSSDAFSERLRVAAGVRYNDTGGHESTVGNISALFEINDYLYVQGIVGTSFMLPSAENLYRVHCPSGINCTHGNPTLGPEESVSVNVSVGGRLDVGERPLSWQITTWDRSIDNLIQAQPIPAELAGQFPPEFTRTFINMPVEVKGRGFEYLLRGPITQSLSFDISYTDSREYAVGSSVQLPDRPRRQYKGSLAWAHQTLPFGFNVAFKYMGQRRALGVVGFGDVEFGDAHVVDAGAHLLLGQERQHRLTLRLENLFDKDYATAVNSAVLTGSTPQERFMWQRLAPPRTTYLNYSYQF